MHTRSQRPDRTPQATAYLLCAVPASPSEPVRRRSLLGWVAAGLSFVLLYLWDDVLFAAPIILAVRLVGTVPAFVVLTLVYGVASWALAMLAVRTFDRRAHGGHSRLEAWIERQAEGRRGGWVKGLITSGRIVGFLLASFLLGGIVTTWMVRYAGRRDRIGLIAVASSGIFALTFVGFYSGVGKLFLDR